MQVFDCHIHTTYSFDGKASIEQQCEKALSLGFSGVVVADHNLPPHKDFPLHENIRTSVLAANEMKKRYSGRLKVFAGLELGDPLTDENYPYQEIYEIDGLDCILGSIHSTPICKKYFPNHPDGDNLLDIARKGDVAFVKEFMGIYYQEYYQLCKNVDVDIVTHITFPFRYVNGVLGYDLDISEYDAPIKKALCAVIETGKTLEINTSGFSMGWREFMPNERILTMYYELGGRNVSLGSDAHKTENLGVAFETAGAMLKKIGFTHGSYYESRQRKTYLL